MRDATRGMVGTDANVTVDAALNEVGLDEVHLVVEALSSVRRMLMTVRAGLYCCVGSCLRCDSSIYKK